MDLVHAIWTLVLLLIFVGIVAWAYSGKRKKRFEEAARLPLEDDDTPEPYSREKNNG